MSPSPEPVSYVAVMSSADFVPSFGDVPTRAGAVIQPQPRNASLSSMFLPLPCTIAGMPTYPSCGFSYSISSPNGTDHQDDHNDQSRPWLDDTIDDSDKGGPSNNPNMADDASATLAEIERRRLKNFFQALGTYSVLTLVEAPIHHEPDNVSLNGCVAGHYVSITTAAAAADSCNLDFAQSLQTAEVLIGSETATENALKCITCAREMRGPRADDPGLSILEANSDLADECGIIPLIRATAGGHKDIVKSLLSRGADVNAVDDGGRTALLIASALGYTEIITLLMDNGADINARSHKGFSPLMIAVRSGCPDTVCTLLGYPLDLKVAESRYGYTALMMAINSSQDYLVELLIKHHEPSDLNVQDDMGLTALMHAAIREKADIASLLLKQGAACETQDSEGKTALHYAAQKGCLKIVMDLLLNNADTNKQDAKGYTPLMYSLENDQVLTAYRILQGPQHIDLLPTTPRGHSALAIAAQKRQRHIFVELLRRSIPLDSRIFRKTRDLILD